MKDNPVLYRKRMIPEECVLLKDDKVLELTDDIIINQMEHPQAQERTASWILLLFSQTRI